MGLIKFGVFFLSKERQRQIEPDCSFFFFFFCFVLFCFVLFCFVLFCFVLFCFVLLCFWNMIFPICLNGPYYHTKLYEKIWTFAGLLFFFVFLCHFREGSRIISLE